MRKRFVTVVLALVLLFAVAAPAQAGVYLNTIDDTAQIAQHGRVVTVTGPIGCDAGEVAHLRVEVRQSHSDALSVGTGHLICTGSEILGTSQTWLVNAGNIGATPLHEGPATVEAWVVTEMVGGAETDLRNWSKVIELQ